MKKRILAGLLSLVMILSVAPTAAFAADDGAELGITSAVVAEFRQNGSGTMQDVDITDGKAILRWQYEAAYTVRVRINTEDGTTGRCLTVTLPQGMEFVALADGGDTEVVIAWNRSTASRFPMPGRRTIAQETIRAAMGPFRFS